MNYIRDLKSFFKKKYYKFKYNIYVANNCSIGAYSKIRVKNLKLNDNTTIGLYSWIEEIYSYFGLEYNGYISIGKNVNIGNYACITSINKVIIGEGCLLSEHVYITDHYHGHNPNDGLLIEQKLFSKGETVIGENTFIGYRVSILSGVHIGHNSVVGSHSVVTKSFGPYSMIGGCPAKLIKKFNHIENKWMPV
jgi:acetyltransferase-like isoleucine patch superfamily enzyme